MNLLKLKMYDSGRIVYEYQPEGRGDAGEVIFDISTMQGALQKRASADDPENLYGSRALLKVEELVQHNNIPLKCTQAWY